MLIRSVCLPKFWSLSSVYVTRSYGLDRVLFFKQKTAYEMRISDWSSDVCSSDLWPQLHVGNLAQQQWRALFVATERNLPKVLQRAEIAARAHHVFGTGHFQHRAAAGLIALAHRLRHLPQVQAMSGQPIWIGLDLALPPLATDAGNLRNARHALQFVLEEEILHSEQFSKIVT